ncbi:MAG: hypothetical protein WCT07_03350, partial [Candidatus Paceibacterota bacterium]
SVSYGGFIPYIIESIKSIVATLTSFKDNFTTNNIHTKNLCVGDTCFTESQLKALLQKSNISQAPALNSNTSPITINANLILNGSKTINLNLGASWTDILGANYNHDGFTDVIYSTSTVDTKVVGTTTIDYFATYISAASSTVQETLHITRDIVVTGANITTETTTTETSQPVSDTTIPDTISPLIDTPSTSQPTDSNTSTTTTETETLTVETPTVQ